MSLTLTPSIVATTAVISLLRYREGERWVIQSSDIAHSLYHTAQGRSKCSVQPQMLTVECGDSLIDYVINTKLYPVTFWRSNIILFYCTENGRGYFRGGRALLTRSSIDAILASMHL